MKCFSIMTIGQVVFSFHYCSISDQKGLNYFTRKKIMFNIVHSIASTPHILLYCGYVTMPHFTGKKTEIYIIL